MLLLLVFAQLPRLHGRRQLLAIWTVAWAAKVVVASDNAFFASYALSDSPIFGALGLFAEFLYWPGTLLFLAMISLGTIQFVGRQFSSAVVQRVGLGAVLLGAVLSALKLDAVGRGLELICTPLLLFGCVQYVLRHADGPRRRGLMILASGMTLFASFAVFNLLDFLNYLKTAGTLALLVRGVASASPYTDTFSLMILGAAVVVLIVQDSVLEVIQERSERLQVLATSEERLQRIIEAAREAIITIDANGRIDLANAAAERLFRLAPGDAIDRNLAEFIELSGRPVSELLGRATSTPSDGGRDSTVTVTATGHRTDGASFPIEFTVGALARGEAGESVMVIRDLTQRRAAEVERELFERRMAEAEKMLAIGRVVSGVAHELNNPLAVVLGQSEQLVDSAMDDDARNGLRLINEQAHRARHIVKDLLAFVRRREEKREAINVASLAQRVVTAQAAQAADHGVTLTTRLPERLPPVMADRVAVEQVLVNLLDNAMDAAGPGGSVTVAARAFNGRSELVVEDSGTGIQDDLVPRIFEPFFTTKPTGEGTGLGLSVSLGLAEQQGGNLRVENRPAPGIGARFILALPIDPDAMAAVPGPRRTVTLPQPVKRADGSVALALIIDDEAAVRATLARIFQRGGWPYREAASGEEGLAWLLDVGAEEAPAIILCDLKMPGMNGREVYRHLLERRPDLVPRVIFVTGDVVEPVTAGFLATTGREVVEKPFTVAEIAGAVERVVNRG
ncbi:MAG TPA: ATP-binding protein [Gemmatimonadales bacterium]|nr:ATP-binding protein [Gemmatimonadales bacterium]